MALVAVRTRRKNTSGWNAEKLPVKAFALVRKTARPISQIGDGAAMALNPVTNDNFNAVQPLGFLLGGDIRDQTVPRGHNLFAHHVGHADVSRAQSSRASRQARRHGWRPISFSNLTCAWVMVISRTLTTAKTPAFCKLPSRHPSRHRSVEIGDEL